MIKRVLGVVSLIALIGGIYVYWMFNKPHEDVSKLPADYTISAIDLLKEFSENAASADLRYSGKVIQLEGAVTKLRVDTDQTIFSIDPGGNYVLQAYLPAKGNDLTSVVEGAVVNLKGKYAGYVINDADFLIPADIKLEPCYIQL